jgi:crossover junction endodeoxyribonuclease RuvC
VFVLGIDPGLSRCGYGVVTRRTDGSGSLAACSAGVIETDPLAPLPDRLLTVQRELRALMDEVRPAAVAVERVFFQVNARTAMSVGQASGLALAAAAETGCEVVQYTSNEVKQALVGYGSASKDQVQQMVARVLGLPEAPRPPDVADALALAVCHLTTMPLRRALERAVSGAGRSGVLGGGSGSGSGSGPVGGSVGGRSATGTARVQMEAARAAATRETETSNAMQGRENVR